MFSPPFFSWSSVFDLPFVSVIGSTAVLQGASRRDCRAVHAPPGPQNVSGRRGGLFASQRGQTAPPSGNRNEQKRRRRFGSRCRRPEAGGGGGGAAKTESRPLRAYPPVP